MPQTKQAKKALRQNKKKAEHNKIIRSTTKTLVKKTRKSIEKGEKVDDMMKQTIKSIDKAAQKGLIKKNTAARRKSRLMKQLNKTSKK